VSIRARVGGVRIPPYTELLTDEGVGIVHSIPIQFRSVSMRTYSAYTSSKGHGRRSAFEHNYIHIRNGSPTRGWWISDGVRRHKRRGGSSKRRASSEGGLRAVRLVERMLREVCLRCGTGTYHPASLPASSCLLLLPPPPPPASRVLLAVFFCTGGQLRGLGDPCQVASQNVEQEQGTRKYWSSFKFLSERRYAKLCNGLRLKRPGVTVDLAGIGRL